LAVQYGKRKGEVSTSCAEREGARVFRFGVIIRKGGSKERRIFYKIRSGQNWIRLEGRRRPK